MHGGFCWQRAWGFQRKTRVAPAAGRAVRVRLTSILGPATMAAWVRPFPSAGPMPGRSSLGRSRSWHLGVKTGQVVFRRLCPDGVSRREQTNEHVDTDSYEPTPRPNEGAARRRNATGGRRSGWWLLVTGGILAMLGALVWGLSASAGMVKEVESWQRAGVPGSVEVIVDEPGELVVRSERTGFVRWGSPSDLSDVSVTGPGGQTVAVADVAAPGQYRVPGRAGRSVVTFDAATPGTYRVAVKGSSSPDAQFAVGEPLWPATLGGVVGAMVVGLTGLLATAGGITGLVAHRRRRDDGNVNASAARRARIMRSHRRTGDRGGLVRLAGYAGLAVGLTWAVWVPALTLLGEAGVPLVLLGAFGPAVAAAIMVRVEGGRVRSWLKRIFRFRLPVRWYVAALALPLLEPVTTTAVAVAHGAPLAVGELPARLPLVAVGFVVVLLVGGGQEELGWRGYLLPRLQAQLGPLAASVLIGVLWAVWHLPLFTLDMPGYTYESVSFLVYLPIVVAISVAFTWLFNHTAGSVLPAMLLHAAFNNWDSLTPVSEGVDLDARVELGMQVVTMAGYGLLAVMLIVLGGVRLGARTRPTIESTSDR